MKAGALLLGLGLALAACAPRAADDRPVSGNRSEAAPPAVPSAEAALAGIPDVERQYYEVSGDSLFAIRRALNSSPSRPRDPNDGLGVDALSSWYIAWRSPAGADGSCDLSRAEIRFSARIRMPRLVETAATPPAVRSRWRAYVAALERHEANHVRNAWEKRTQVLAAIRASSCANAGRDALAAVRQLARQDVAYDRRTRHGLTEGAHFP